MKGLILLVLLLACLVESEAQSVPLDTTYTVYSTYNKLIKEYPDISPVHEKSALEIEEHRDIEYLTLTDTPYGIRTLHADVFLPKGDKKKYPALLLIHGGGWRSGNKSMNTPLAQHLAARGFVVVSVEYRLSLEAKYPAAIYDIKAAIRWMRKSASEYKIDIHKIAVGGASAGGQLASLIGATNGIEKFEGRLGYQTYSSKVQAVIDLDGLLDFTNNENLAVKRTANSADVFWLEGFYNEIPDRWKEASAITWVNKNSPPFLFINSSQTRFHAGCKETIDKLNQYKIYSEVHQLQDAPHSFWLFNPWFEPTVNYMATFLNKLFNTESVNK